LQTTDSFQHFVNELSEKVGAAREAGWQQGQIVQQATRLGDWLAREVSPRTPEQKLLKELWQAADEREQQAIASSIVKLVQRQGKVH